MKANIIGLLALAQASYCHFTFPVLIVNNTESHPWQYVRDVGPDPTVPDQGDYSKALPLYNVSSEDIICNRYINSGPKTQTATVIAGDQLAFRPNLGYPGLDATFYHDGPGLVYLSKAPNDDLGNYKGDGDWFKIAYAGPASDTAWSIYNQDRMKFTVPKRTPPGKYLMRMEMIYPHDQSGETQFYVSCAQINVVGPGGGRPSNFTRFPGGYSLSDRGILVTSNQFRTKDLLSYMPPGPPVWEG